MMRVWAKDQPFGAELADLTVSGGSAPIGLSCRTPADLSQAVLEVAPLDGVAAERDGTLVR
jgi:hypothetical protein